MSLRLLGQILSIFAVFVCTFGSAFAEGDNNGCVVSASVKKAEVSMAFEISSAAKNRAKLSQKTLNEARRLAQQCDGGIAYILGLVFVRGTVVDKNLDEGKRWFAQASHAGVIPARFELAKMYVYGKKLPESKEGIDMLKRLSKRMGAASYALAYFYQKGISVNKNLKLAEQYYVKSYAEGYKPGSYGLALLYFDEEKYSESYPYFERSLKDEGRPGALFYLGLMDVYGIRGKAKVAAGYLNIEKACEFKYAKACDFVKKNKDVYKGPEH